MGWLELCDACLVLVGLFALWYFAILFSAQEEGVSIAVGYGTGNWETDGWMDGWRDGWDGRKAGSKERKGMGVQGMGI